MASSIIFVAEFGFKLKKVEISEPNGMGGNIWQVYIDNFYQGVITKRDGEWVSLLHPDCGFTADDIQALCERIDE